VDYENVNISFLFVIFFGIAQGLLEQKINALFVMNLLAEQLNFIKIFTLRKISCSGCHGGNSKSEDMDIAMIKSSGFKGVLKGDDISLACAKCHADNETMKKYGSNLQQINMSY
jgi:hypothetical protein